MKFTRKDFYSEVFQPYNDAVKRGEYEKIDYQVWRTLRDWCCDIQWKDFYIKVMPIADGYDFFLWDDLRCSPDMITLARTAKHDFAKYLEEHNSEYNIYDINYTSQILNQYYTNSLIADNSTYNYFSNDSIATTISTITTDYYKSDIDELVDKVCKQMEEHNKKEKKEMKFGNFDFGPVDSSVRLSLYGMAIKNAAGTYVAYDSKSKQIMDVDILNFDGANKFMYKMPVALSDVKTGDVVIHSRRPMFVIEVNKDNRFKVLDIYDGEEKTIVPSRSVFGFDFMTKIVSLFGFATESASEQNPFGNLLPLMLMENGKDSKDMLLPLMLMGQNVNNINPMLMYAMMSDSNDKNLLPLLLMNNGLNALASGQNQGKAD